MQRPKLLRITTVPISLHLLLNGQFRFMTAQGFDVLTVSAAGNEVADVLREGAGHVAVRFTRKITPLTDLICLVQLISVILRFKPDIVHTHTPKAGLLGMIAAWLCRVPVRMHTVAGLPFVEAKGFKSLVLRWSEKITYGCARQVYPNSLALKDFLIKEMGVAPSKLNVLGNGSSNGINSEFFKPSAVLQAKAQEIRAQYFVAQEELAFIFIGRIVRDKGVVELVTAFENLAKKRPARLFLVGSFEEELDPLPEATMRFLKEDGRIVMPGFQKDVRPWLLACDIFVLPSYREGFPNVVMQACCMEIPCVVTNINGSNEIIQSEQTGLIVKVKDDADLYKAMDVLGSNPDLRKEFGRRSRAFVTAHFDQMYVWGELLKEYQTMLRTECIQ